MIVKKGINQRKRAENQLGLLLNTHNNLKKGQGSFPLLATIALLECCSPQHGSSEPRQGFLCVQLCVCVLCMGVFKTTDLHTNSLSKFTEGRRGDEGKEGRKM